MPQATYAPAPRQHRTSDPSHEHPRAWLSFNTRAYYHNGACLPAFRARYGARRWFETHPY